MRLPEREKTAGPAIGTRSIIEILGDLAALERPARRSKASPAETRDQAIHRKAELIGELYLADPGHGNFPACSSSAGSRWRGSRSYQECEDAAKLPRGDPKGDSACYVAARLAIRSSWTDPARASTHDRDARRACLPGGIHACRNCWFLCRSKDQGRVRPCRELSAMPLRLPASPYAGVAEAGLEAIDAELFQSAVDPAEAAADIRIGQPFEFAFLDAVSGQLVSSKALKGRVLVINFGGHGAPWWTRSRTSRR